MKNIEGTKGHASWTPVLPTKYFGGLGSCILMVRGLTRTAQHFELCSVSRLISNTEFRFQGSMLHSVEFARICPVLRPFIHGVPAFGFMLKLKRQ